MVNYHSQEREKTCQDGKGVASLYPAVVRPGDTGWRSRQRPADTDQESASRQVSHVASGVGGMELALGPGVGGVKLALDLEVRDIELVLGLGVQGVELALDHRVGLGLGPRSARKEALDLGRRRQHQEVRAGRPQDHLQSAEEEKGKLTGRFLSLLHPGSEVLTVQWRDVGHTGGGLGVS